MGGGAIDSAAPLDRMPLYVRAGSILPMGPELQYSTEKPEDPIELRVYAGRNGSFTLYEDENDTYGYEKGAYATIPFVWDDAAKTLTIGDRAGKFPGMLETRTFRIVFVSDGHGAGIGAPDTPEQPDKIVTYSGATVVVRQ
jgi:alpha-D-xyloside xylohydrolase